MDDKVERSELLFNYLFEKKIFAFKTKFLK